MRQDRGRPTRPRLGAQLSTLTLAAVVLLKHQVRGVEEIFVAWRGIWRAHQPVQQLRENFVLLVLGKRFEGINQLFGGIRHPRDYTPAGTRVLTPWFSGGPSAQREDRPLEPLVRRHLGVEAGTTPVGCPTGRRE